MLSDSTTYQVLQYIVTPSANIRIAMLAAFRIVCHSVTGCTQDAFDSIEGVRRFVEFFSFRLLGSSSTGRTRQASRPGWSAFPCLTERSDSTHRSVSVEVFPHLCQIRTNNYGIALCIQQCVLYAALFADTFAYCLQQPCLFMSKARFRRRGQGRPSCAKVRVGRVSYERS